MIVSNVISRVLLSRSAPSVRMSHDLMNMDAGLVTVRATTCYVRYYIPASAFCSLATLEGGSYVVTLMPEISFTDPGRLYGKLWTQIN